MQKNKNTPKGVKALSIKEEKVYREPRRKLTEMFLNNASEIVKLYSSVHRVHNYYLPADRQTVESRQLGDKRSIRKFSESDWLNPFTPKISYEAYTWLKENEELWSAYQNQVLRNDVVEESHHLFLASKPDYFLQNGRIEPTYLRVIA